MAINPSRQEARLAKTNAAIEALRSKINGIKAEKTELCAEWLDLVSKVDALDAEIHEAHSKNESTASAEALCAPLIVERDREYELIKDIKNDLCGQIGDLSCQLAGLLGNSAAQTIALNVVTASYPRLLARHLNKCKRHGWADARLKAKK